MLFVCVCVFYIYIYKRIFLSSLYFSHFSFVNLFSCFLRIVSNDWQKDLKVAYIRFILRGQPFDSFRRLLKSVKVSQRIYGLNLFWGSGSCARCPSNFCFVHSFKEEREANEGSLIFVYLKETDLLAVCHAFRVHKM